MTGWGRTAPTLATVHTPRTVTDVERSLKLDDGRGVIARGLGRSYGDAAQNAGGHVLEMVELATGLELDSERGQVTVSAGMSLDALMRELLPLGWFVSVTPGTRYVTVGGAIASDVHGKNHHRDGSFCDHVLSFDLVLPSGEMRTVTAEGDPDVFWATAGGMGLTGVIINATLKLIPVETAYISVDTERATDLDDAMSRMESGDMGYRYSVAWIDCLAQGGKLGRSVLTRGDHAGLDELPQAFRQDALEFKPKTGLKAPAWAPSGLLRPATVRAFNEAWFRKSPRQERSRIKPISAFFHPLDGLLEWNRLYGRRGFIQYQLAVPFGREDSIRAILERVSSSGFASFLAVLKRFGEQRGMISFPIPGWTLALDIPARAGGLTSLTGELDGFVAEAGGRIYLAKDSCMRPELLGVMYPELDRWRAVRDGLDPERRLRSDLDRRLSLIGPAS